MILRPESRLRKLTAAAVVAEIVRRRFPVPMLANEAPHGSDDREMSLAAVMCCVLLFGRPWPSGLGLPAYAMYALLGTCS